MVILGIQLCGRQLEMNSANIKPSFCWKTRWDIGTTSYYKQGDKSKKSTFFQTVKADFINADNDIS